MYENGNLSTNVFKSNIIELYEETKNDNYIKKHDNRE